MEVEVELGLGLGLGLVGFDDIILYALYALYYSSSLYLYIFHKYSSILYILYIL